MTARGAVSRLRRDDPLAVILAPAPRPALLRSAVILGTPVITAIGCDNWGVGNPEEQSQSPVIFPLHLNMGSVGV